MSYSDDDIKFLGGTDFKPSQLTDKQQSASRRWWIGVIALAFIALSAATFYFWQKAIKSLVTSQHSRLGEDADRLVTRGYDEG